MWRIESITIRNFKFFSKPYTLDFAGKNMLIYGENGSGKSSIYWSFFTHFQACTKKQKDVAKYFTQSHPHNLRNRFCPEDEDSYISVTFTDGNSSLSIPYSATNYVSVGTDAHNFMSATMKCSDFINYKFLSSIFEFSNSRVNDVFAIFEKEFFPFIEFDENISSTFWNAEENSNNADILWRRLHQLIPQLPCTDKHATRVNRRTNEYKEYMRILGKFNVSLRNYLGELEARVNNMLDKEFKQAVKLHFNYCDAEFNRKISARSFDKKLHNPNIIITAQMIDSGVINTQPIEHPGTFFNEAKLTTMALAIRLAILERHPNLSNSASVFFIDDLLISLDMGMRSHVIPLILRYVSKFQLIVLTHDRGFFHLIKSHLELEKSLGDWKCLEIYRKVGKIPEPVILNHTSDLEKAWIHYERFETAAAANAARRAFERMLKNLLPSNCQICVNNNDEPTNVSLKHLIDKFTEMCGRMKIRFMPFIDTYRYLILNPFSHDDIDTPIYRSELKLALEDLDKLSKFRREMHISYNDVKTREFLIKAENISCKHDCTAKIVFLEPLFSWTNGKETYYSNPHVKVIDCPDEKCRKMVNNLISAVYSRLIHAVSLSKERDTGNYIEQILQQI